MMAVVPRPASTVVLVDENARVYMTKRPQTMKFFGGFYVFPGGAVEKDDEIEDSETFIQSKPDESIDKSFYIAAARELFEEVGVLLCETEDGTAANLKEATAKEYRRQMMLGELSYRQMLRKEGLKFSFKCLTPFGHLITPEESPIRYDTRFFLADLPKGQTPEPDEHEVGEACWISPADALTAFQNDEIELGPPTILALKTVKNFLEGGPLVMPKLQGQELFNYRLTFKRE